MKQLSEFLNKYDDEQGCEIIDVIWNCKDFRKDLMKDQKAEIKTELKLSLEELTKLSGHDEIKTAGKDLKEVVKDVIYIKKIKPFMSSISRYGVDWYKEYYKNERIILRIAIKNLCSKEEKKLKLFGFGNLL